MYLPESLVWAMGEDGCVAVKIYCEEGLRKDIVSRFSEVFNEEYEKFLSNYKFLDKDSFFTPQLLSEINKIIDELGNCAYFEINNLDKRKTKLNESFKATLKDYYKIEHKINIEDS